MNEPKKGLSPLVWIGIGCGGLLLVGAVVLSVGGYFAVKTASDFVGDNPAAAAAEAIVRINPELELVESDREGGTITVRESSTGKEGDGQLFAAGARRIGVRRRLGRGSSH